MNVLAYPGEDARPRCNHTAFCGSSPVLDERSRRLVAASESAAIGRGGISAVSRATGVSRQVIRQGMAELSETGVRPPGRIRRPCGGRKKTAAGDPALARDLERLVEPVTRGDPESPFALDLQELTEVGRRTARNGTSNQPLDGGPNAA